MINRSILMRSLAVATFLIGADAALAQQPAAQDAPQAVASAPKSAVTAEQMQAFKDNPNSLLATFGSDLPGLTSQVQALLEFAAQTDQLADVLKALQSLADASGITPEQIAALTKGANAAAAALAGTPAQAAIQTALLQNANMRAAQLALLNQQVPLTSELAAAPVVPTTTPIGGGAPAATGTTSNVAPNEAPSRGVSANAGTGFTGASGGGSSSNNDDNNGNSNPTDNSPVTRG